MNFYVVHLKACFKGYTLNVALNIYCAKETLTCTPALVFIVGAEVEI